MSSARRWHGLHVLADDDPRWPGDPVAQAAAACDGGAAVVQLRAKRATDSRVLTWAREIRALTRASGTRFVVNDRFDIAWLSEADAVHLGQDDLPPEAIPKAAREHLAVGRSTHDLAQATRALEEDVDYLAFGPLFGTSSKDSPFAARGLPALEEIVRVAGQMPVVAIGGIDAARLPSVVSAGASAAAVISAVADAPDPVAATAGLQACFPAASGTRA